MFPGPPRGHAKINSDAHALAQIEALLGREALERAAHSCHKQILESPTDKVSRAPPPALHELCQRGRATYFAGVVGSKVSRERGRSGSSGGGGGGGGDDGGGDRSEGTTGGSSSSSSSSLSSSSSSASSSLLTGDSERTSGSADNLVEQIKFPTEAYDLLERCLEVNPMLRISAKEALAHPFLCLQRK